MRISLAIRVFFKALFDQETAIRLEEALTSDSTPKLPSTEPSSAGDGPPREKRARPASPPARSDAVTLLATLQREARFVDMIKEPLTDYSDAQIGAAARDVLRDCGKVVERLFVIQPVSEKTEGEQVHVEVGFDPGCYRLTGNVTGDPPYDGTLVHHGWKISECNVPKWTGSSEAAKIVAPVELELK